MKPHLLYASAIKETIIIVSVIGGFVDEVTIEKDVPTAKKMARKLWKEMDPETDDLKVLGLETGTLYWGPKN